jgi:Membrane protease subunits, stomatin/prohibitin homologs
MMQNKILVSLGAVLFIGMMCVFSVNETEKAIKFRLGEIVKNDYEPGLHFKWPFINNVKSSINAFKRWPQSLNAF